MYKRYSVSNQQDFVNEHSFEYKLVIKHFKPSAMKDFLSKTGLYNIHTLLENYQLGNEDYTSPYDFVGETFEYKCEYEDSIKTFEIELDEETLDYFGSHSGDQIPPRNFINEKLDYTFKAIGKCKSCNDYHIIFLLHVFSNNPISNIRDNVNNINFSKQNGYKIANTNIYIQKVGALPEIKIVPDKIITKYFGKETNGFYYKGLNALNQNFGIGAFAYFRRIIEKELINIITDIKSLPDSHSAEIEKLLKKHNDNPKISTIYDNIFEHLPNSLKSLGDNPIKLLYNQTSEGLHSLSEEQCLEKANSILLLLNFVIKKINEERSEIKSLRETIKGLK